MSPNLTVGFMAEQTNRGRLDGVAARGRLAEEVVVTRSRATRPASMLAMLGAALIRLGARIQGKAQPVGPQADSIALPAR